jgi:hypothetical protein
MPVQLDEADEFAVNEMLTVHTLKRYYEEKGLCYIANNGRISHFDVELRKGDYCNE